MRTPDNRAGALTEGIMSYVHSNYIVNAIDYNKLYDVLHRTLSTNGLADRIRPMRSDVKSNLTGIDGVTCAAMKCISPSGRMTEKPTFKNGGLVAQHAPPIDKATVALDGSYRVPASTVHKYSTELLNSVNRNVLTKEKATQTLIECGWKGSNKFKLKVSL